MIKAALEYLKAELGQPTFKEAGSRTYSSRPLYHFPDAKEPAAITVNTLTGLRDYIKRDLDAKCSDAFIHVEGHNKVSLVTGLFGEFEHQRSTLIEAVTSGTLEQNFGFGAFWPIPEFIIGLQAYFAETKDRETILQLVSSIKAGQSQQYLDNGYSQEVAAKRGTSSLIENTKVPNPVTLKPYRTFLEVEQPESSFVFRLRPGTEGQPPQCGLFEASGGAWKLDAILKVKQWLEAQDLGVAIIA